MYESAQARWVLVSLDWRRCGTRNADSPIGKDVDVSRRVTLEGRLHPQWGRSDVVGAACELRGQQEGRPEEAEHHT
jgi:hypothetical protein